MPRPAQPDALAQVCARRSLTPGSAYPGGSAASVVRVRRADGTAAVVKLARRHFEAEHEADGLRVWDGDGAVRLLEFARLDDTTDALLLEACEPGTAASSLLLQWLFARCVVECDDQPELAAIARRLR
jgi:streptomycin 6-kinase